MGFIKILATLSPNEVKEALLSQAAMKGNWGVKCADHGWIYDHGNSTGFQGLGLPGKMQEKVELNSFA